MSSLKIDTSVKFDPAGVTFSIQVDLPPAPKDSKGASIVITPLNTATGKTIPMTVESCPVLVDFAPAFNRWMRTRMVAGTVGKTQITGSFNADADVEHLLRYTADIVDMIGQRFGTYEESVLT